MPKLVFSNPGEIDVRLITTMGVNAKPQGGAIGYFGTGLKYAIAGTLRLGGRITIWSGLTRLSFRAKREEIRGKEFEIVHMTTTAWSDEWRDIPLAFTLDLGKDWQPWMLYRELWCNCMDEKGMVGLGEASPAEGWTTVEVECEELLAAHANRREWQLWSQPIWSGQELELHPAGGPKGVFYKGIRVMELDEPGPYTLNFTGEMKLSEDRTLDYFNVFPKMTNIMAEGHMPQVVVQKILLHPKARLNFYSCFTPAESFVETVCKVYQGHPETISKEALTFISRHLPDERKMEMELKGVTLTALEERALAKAKEFLAKWLGVDVKTEIIPIDKTGSHWTLGLAKAGKIYLPRQTFGKGVKMLASTLLEEWLHAERELGDCERSMQDWLMDKCVSLGEEMSGEPL